MHSNRAAGERVDGSCYYFSARACRAARFPRSLMNRTFRFSSERPENVTKNVKKKLKLIFARHQRKCLIFFFYYKPLPADGRAKKIPV